jgi:hypothetical protein
MKSVTKVLHFRTPQKIISAGYYDNSGDVKAVFMSVAGPNLGDSKTSDNATILLLVTIFNFRTIVEESF